MAGKSVYLSEAEQIALCMLIEAAAETDLGLIESTINAREGRRPDFQRIIDKLSG